MKWAIVGARVILGLIFVVFSLNFFVPFLPQPEMGPEAGTFIGALIGSGYVFHVAKVVELGAGIMLLAGILVPLALTLLAPIIINIVLFHLFLEPGGAPIGIIVLALELFLVWAYRGSFRGVLEVKAKPTAGA